MELSTMRNPNTNSANLNHESMRNAADFIEYMNDLLNSSEKSAGKLEGNNE
jgi:hypothetical protein